MDFYLWAQRTSCSQLRAIAAATAAAVATCICTAQRHVRVVLSEPATYASPLRHKCGLLLIGCALWAALELTRLLAGTRRPAGGHHHL